MLATHGPVSQYRPGTRVLSLLWRRRVSSEKSKSDLSAIRHERDALHKQVWHTGM